MNLSATFYDTKGTYSPKGNPAVRLYSADGHLVFSDLAMSRGNATAAEWVLSTQYHATPSVKGILIAVVTGTDRAGRRLVQPIGLLYCTGE